MSKKPLFTPADYKNPKELFDENTLGDMVNTYLSQENYNRSQLKSKERQEQLKFYPSSLGMPDRDIVLSMLGYIGKPKSGETMLILENGTSFHNRMEALFEDMGIMVAPELSLKHPKLYISGRSDAIIWNYLREEGEPDGEIITLTSPDGTVVYEGPENYVMLVEFKSIAENGYYNLRKSRPNDAHEQQLQLYFYLTGITKGIVYYENKNNQKHTEYIVDRDEELIHGVVNRIKKLINYAKERKIPESEFTPTDIPAQFSDFRDITHPDTNPFYFDELLEIAEEEGVEI